VKRTKWIDVARGVAIILVVVAHTYRPPGSLVNQVIFSFHMPFFFVLAGYLFDYGKYRDRFGMLVVSRATRLLLPLAVFVLVRYVVNRLVVPFWFLPALFVANLVLWCLLRVTERRHVGWLIAGAIALSGAGILVGPVPIGFDLGVDLGLAATVFLVAGHLLRRHGLPERMPWLAVVACVAIWVLGVWQGGISMNNRQFFNPLFSFSGGIAGSILLMLAARRLARVRGLATLLAYTGRQTVVIYLTAGISTFPFDVMFRWPVPGMDALRGLVFGNWIGLSTFWTAYSLGIAEGIRRVPLARSLVFWNEYPLFPPSRGIRP
jgi:fucose 4-O-acetylase-like acetyltransferase